MVNTSLGGKVAVGEAEATINWPSGLPTGTFLRAQG